MNLFDNISFSYPYILVLILVYIILIKFFKQKNEKVYFSNMKLLEKNSSNQNYLQEMIKFLAFTCLIIALASPVKKEKTIIDNIKGHEISLIVDVSAGMQDDKKFIVTKKIVKEFIQKRKNDRLALSVFANFAYVAVPLSYDKKSLLDTLKYIQIGVAGYRDTALYEALYLGSDIFKNSKSENKIIIIITDGLNTVNTVSLETSIDKLIKYGIKVYAIGIGIKDDNTSKNDLEVIAKQSKGKYYKVKDIEELASIYDEIDSLEKSDIKTEEDIHYKYFYMYFLYVALFLLFIQLFNKRNKI